MVVINVPDETAAPPDDAPAGWGSDAIAEALRATGVPYVALNPGSSYRGLHDSLVNYLGDRDPSMLVCLHEEHAVAIAHGYAKVTGEPMAVALHANVGLMHAAMAVYNAYCDRVPMIIVGATGPVDADRRRPWIDWLHTSADQAALVRDYVKWDDQPASAPASVAALLRGNQLTRTHPMAPVYLCFDVGVQEAELTGEPPTPRAERYPPFPDAQPSTDAVDAAVRLLAEAGNVVILAGGVGHDQHAWQRRIELAERLGASVVTDLKVGAGFPTDHPSHGAAPGLFINPANLELIRAADVVLSLDWLDLGGTLRQAYGEREVTARIVVATIDHQLWGGWAKVDQALHPADVLLHCRADVAVPALLERLPAAQPASTRDAPFTPEAADRTGQGAADQTGPTGAITVAHLQDTLREATSDRAVTLIRVPFAWDAARWPIGEPLDYLGADGGAGIGSGPGLAVGAALALRGGDRLPVAVLGDGDYLMGVTALWTAARHEIPLLVVVANNNSFFNDEVHQYRVARTRSRPVGNAHVGMRLQEPDPDVAGLARDLGFTGHGPIRDPADLGPALRKAVLAVRDGGQAVVDVRVERGYSAETAAAVANSP
ncbi:MAG: thiamine pyrophosphate-binding protein [Pseudonocardiaceae bacterium]|nr:thiamine pyrophosphate-binding protein [Pseudonocardiaceae bacterium]